MEKVIYEVERTLSRPFHKKGGKSILKHTSVNINSVLIFKLQENNKAFFGLSKFYSRDICLGGLNFLEVILLRRSIPTKTNNPKKFA
jgi:hypothetical protein